MTASDTKVRVAVVVSGLATATALAYTAPGAPWARADVLASPTGPRAIQGPPAASVMDTAHEATSYNGVIRTATRTVLVDALPATVGINTIAVTVLDAKGTPAKVEQWSATASLPGADVPDVPVPLTSFGEGVAAADSRLPVAGKWDLTITVRIAGAGPASFTHILPIGPQS